MKNRNPEIDKIWSAFRDWTAGDGNIELVWTEKFGYVYLIWDEVSRRFSASEVIWSGEMLLEELLEYFFIKQCIRDDIDTLKIPDEKREQYQQKVAICLDAIPEYWEFARKFITIYGI